MGPEISIVIPTRDRHESLSALLAALAAQTLPPHRFEVIVVDDGSLAPLRVAAPGVSVKVLRHDRPRGPGAARNTGCRVAQGALIAFIDDDCRPSEGWLEALLAAVPDSARSEVVVQGRVEPEPSELDALTPLSHTIIVSGPDRNFACANIAYSRALLERLDGFDERLTSSGEDVDLGARALAAGALQVFAEEARVYHEVRRLSLAGLLRHTWKWTDSVRVLALHPELRDLLVLRLFWKRTHPLLLMMLAGVATRRRCVALPAALPYLAHYRRLYRGELRAMAKALPSHGVLDTFEVATVLVGSVRYRTLML